jgi:hypothetical protein
MHNYRAAHIVTNNSGGMASKGLRAISCQATRKVKAGYIACCQHGNPIDTYSFCYVFSFIFLILSLFYSSLLLSLRFQICQ